MHFPVKLAACACLLISILPCRSQAQTRPDGVSYSDTLHALIVFAKFSDDNSVGDPTLNYRDWELDRTSPPDYSASLLSSSPDGPYPDSSLTAYFHSQSLGKFVIYGTVHPEVFVSAQPESSYHRSNGGGYGYLTAEILAHLDEAGYDFREYDYDEDGVLDYLFVILRRDSVRDAKKVTFTGISCLDAACGGGLVGGRPKETPVHDGITIDWRKSGSILYNRTPGNILPYWYMLRLLAHELGHDIWAPFFTHIPALRYNDVPAKSNRNPGRSCIGYTLMAGAGGAPDCRGDETISAFERDLLGWIECMEPDTSVPSDHILGDLVSASNCLRVPSNKPGTYLYLTNRQRVSAFDQKRRAGRDKQYDAGLLRTTGLLAMLSVNKALDILPADNSLDLSIHDVDYEGDLYGSYGKRQITPFTRPNINGYNIYPRRGDFDWFAITDIAYHPSDPSSMTLSFDPDFRVDPLITSDSWIGPFPDSIKTFGTLVVTDNATLTITSSRLIHTGDIVIKNGGTINVDENASIEMPDCGRVYVDSSSTLNASGSIHFSGNLVTLAGSNVSFSRLFRSSCR